MGTAVVLVVTLCQLAFYSIKLLKNFHSFALGLVIYGLFPNKEKEFVVTGNLLFRSSQHSVWFSTSSLRLSLILILYPPYMRMRISLRVTMSKCTTVTMDTCKILPDQATIDYFYGKTA